MRLRTTLGAVAVCVAGGLSGCGDAFRAHPAVAARVGDRELSAERLAEILVMAQPLPLEPAVARGIARHWVDVTVFGDRMAAGDSLLDSARVAEATRFRERQAVLSAYQRGLAAEAIDLTEAQVDSAYGVADMIIVAHILRLVTPDMTREAKAEQRAIAEGILNRLIQGGSWEEANALSQDENVRDLNGNLGLIKRGQTVPRFENAAFALGPGELSRVVETQAGFHVIYRPRLEEVGTSFAAYVLQEMALRFDSAFAEGLAADERVEVRDGAAAAVREVMADPWSGGSARRVLVSYAGGEVTERRVAEFARYVAPETREEIQAAPDGRVENFLVTLALQEILGRRADSAGTTLPDSVLAELREEYRRAVSVLRANTGLHPDSLASAGVPGEDPARRVAERVDAYLEAAATGRVPLQVVPPLIVVPLLQEADWEIDEAGVERALVLAAQSLAARRDSASGSSPEP